MAVKKAKGKFLFDKVRFQRLGARLADGDYDFTVEKHSNNRSLKQNRAYFACIVRPCSESSGYEEDEVHELLKRFCNPKTVGILNKATGEVEDVTIGRSTTGLSTEEFSLYFARCQQFAAEKWDCYCPDPNQEFMFNATEATNTVDEGATADAKAAAERTRPQRSAERSRGNVHDPRSHRGDFGTIRTPASRATPQGRGHVSP